jgi:hypothetical protein
MNGRYLHSDLYQVDWDPHELTVTGTEPALQLLWGSVITAVRTFTHPESGRAVTLVGTMHIGQYRYFRQLSGVVEALSAAGAEVHVEGINHVDDSPPTQWERDRLAEADRWADPETTGVAVSLLRVESQGVRLRLPDGVRNVDLSHLQLLRRLGWEDYRRVFTPPRAHTSTPRLGLAARAAIRFQFRHPRLVDRFASLRRRDRRIAQVVIEQRNQLAFAAATEALTRGDVALVWGTQHLPGLATLFRSQGYRLSREEWFEACVT